TGRSDGTAGAVTRFALGRRLGASLDAAFINRRDRPGGKKKSSCHPRVVLSSVQTQWRREPGNAPGSKWAVQRRVSLGVPLRSRRRGAPLRADQEMSRTVPGRDSAGKPLGAKHSAHGKGIITDARWDRDRE